MLTIFNRCCHWLNCWMADWRIIKIYLQKDKKMNLETSPFEDYKKFKIAQELPKTLIKKLGVVLAEEDDGIYIAPSDNDIYKWLNKAALRNEIDHGLFERGDMKVPVFHPHDVEEYISGNLKIVITPDLPEVVKVYCFGEHACNSDDVPIEISGVNDLFRIDQNIFNSGPCVYFLVRDNKVVYIGQAENIFPRLHEHQKNKQFDRVFYIRVPLNKLTKIESSLIGSLQPEYNITMKSQSNEKVIIAEGILNKKIEDLQ